MKYLHGFFNDALPLGRTPQGVRGLKSVGQRKPPYDLGRTPQGVRGLKYRFCKFLQEVIGRTPQGVRGLKLIGLAVSATRHLSHPARGAWIEIITFAYHKLRCASHPARGAWIEIAFRNANSASSRRRTPQGVRGLKSSRLPITNCAARSHPARGAWIEMMAYWSPCIMVRVAPRKGCVD